MAEQEPYAIPRLPETPGPRARALSISMSSSIYYIQPVPVLVACDVGCGPVAMAMAICTNCIATVNCILFSTLALAYCQLSAARRLPSTVPWTWYSCKILLHHCSCVLP